MPIFDFKCTKCGQGAERVVSLAERDSNALPCGRSLWFEAEASDAGEQEGSWPTCDGTLQWAGLSAPTVGRAHVFGVIMADGRKVAGHLNKDAPLRRRPR